MMSSLSLKLKCKKCHCSLSEESNGRFCDNCNMDLIAQNLAAELSQHEIHHQHGGDLDSTTEAGVNKSEAEICPGNMTRECRSSFTELPKLGTSQNVSKSNFVSENTPVSMLSFDSQAEIRESKCKQPEEQLEEKEILSNDIVTTTEEAFLEAIDCLPSTSTTQTKFEKSTIERKRKLFETSEILERISKSKEEESSDDEPDVKKPDLKLEPMRTRAKVVQEEAAAMKQLDLSMEEERLGENDEGEEEDDSKGPVRRLTRKALSEIEKYKHPSYEPVQTKSRRTKTFKAKPVYKAPTSQARIYSSDYVFHKGRYYQIGDVVLLRDIKRPGDFFAQITSFLTDQYCHKCATIQWLFPTKQSPPTSFDPRTYFLGYLDEVPRPLSALQPVMHLPSDYYRFNKTPYPPPTPDPLQKHYLWKRTEPVSLEALQQG